MRTDVLFGAAMVLSAALHSVMVGSISAAQAQSPPPVPRGASPAGTGWCSIVIEQDPTRFQLRVAELVAAGGTVHGSNLNAVSDRFYIYALVCRTPQPESKGA